MASILKFFDLAPMAEGALEGSGHVTRHHASVPPAIRHPKLWKYSGLYRKLVIRSLRNGTLIRKVVS